jgi:uncharacterized cupin superfamily protein
VTVPNVFEPEFDDAEERAGFMSRQAQLGRQAHAKRLGASLYELPPGQTTFPYHWHVANEEMLIVLRGAVDLRGPDGWRAVDEGEVVAFPRGERGAHQMRNRGDDAVRFLVISEMRGPEVVVYPDSGKVGARELAPGAPGDALRLNFRADDAVDYWEGEQPPETR